MSPFLALPPEIRSIIYKILLQSALASRIRILYSDNNPRSSWVLSHSMRHKQPFKRLNRGQIEFLDTTSLRAFAIHVARYNIHLADIDDLLFLASTCRRVRSELLPLAWSNADVCIKSPVMYTELRCVFYNKMTSEACDFVRTLYLNVDQDTWVPAESNKIVKLIINRLPRLEQLTVDILMIYDLYDHSLGCSVEALKNLPLRIAVELRHHDHSMPSDGYSEATERKDKMSNEYLQVLRMNISLVRQKRGEEQSKKKQGDQASDVLKATVEMRSLMAG